MSWLVPPWTPSLSSAARHVRISRLKKRGQLQSETYAMFVYHAGRARPECMHVCIYIYTHTLTHVLWYIIFISIHVSISIYIICIYIYICMDMYVYIHTYVCIYIYYIHMHMSVSLSLYVYIIYKCWCLCVNICMWEPQFRSMSTFLQGLQSHRDTAHFHGKPWNPSSRGPCDWRWLAGFRSTHFGRGENGINNGQLHRSIANSWIYVYITHDIWSIMLYMMCSILHIT